MTPSRDPTPLLEVLDGTSTLALATTEPDGSPRATPVYFAPMPDFTLIFLSDPASPHAQNLAHRPKVGAAVYPEVADWREIRGVQVKGTAAMLSEPAVTAALAVYRRRFPFLEQVPEAVERMAVFALRPTWARLIDNRRGWGFSEEWAWE